ncbi:glycoside-pentoside-hexuronide (GPH):cation symporter [Levilactobacillus brevis]|uniref:glycoside-pentoside-hexuronide (GPH):cation symporter n=1 Tax=Levilactobacillus brevis TaxID=1580 RepID=UPI000D3B7D50|nr:glycoside-pentoside-hexuronide (GPH):cation symporter [Levilactobacillus brevis]MCT2887299.1 MFS transporter [Levilactobacillus brevis]MCT3587541.1 MFS transporter [Levilactobacillus brevis]PUD95668.1 MFS transporter [Levilactobacillus brevis]QOP51925.1 MFS transporter [Levilactobacillus brevis]ULH74808.1 glycoside-pentoside-hexuronide (GPH):cation symporter [Levilactobacillus brevis]
MSENAAKAEPAMKNMVPWNERIAYSFSDFACNLSFQMVGTYLMIFYTDTFGLSAAAVGTLFLAARIVDAFDGPFWGIMIDHTHTKWGKSRPYWLWFSIPFAVFCVLVFTTPNMSLTGKLVWAYVTYIGVDVLYSAVNIPITSILPSLTSNPQERVTLSTIRQFMGTAGATLITGITLTMVAFFGHGSTTSARGWFIWALIVAVIVVVIFGFVFKYTTERVQTKSSRKSIPIKESLKALKRNWPWAIIIFINFIYWMGMQTRSQVTVYFFKYNMHDATLASLVLSLQLVALVAVVLTPWTANRIGKRNTMLGGMILAVIGQLLLSLGANNLSVPMIIFATIIGYLGTGYVSGLIAVMLADAVDYGEWINGVRAEGIVTSFSSFSAKLGMGIGGVITGWILTGTGYVANKTQTAGALHGIELNYIWVPLLGFALSGIALMFYHVDGIEKKMQSDLAEKHARENAEDGE